MLKDFAQKMKNASVRRKIKVALGFLAAALAFVSIVASLAIFSLKNNVKSYQNITHASDAVNTCRINLNTMSRYLREMVLSIDHGIQEDYTDDIKRLREENTAQIKVLSSHNFIPENEITEYENAIEEWYAIGDSIIAAVKSGKENEAADLIQEKCNPMLKELISYVDSIYEEIEAEKQSSEKLSGLIYEYLE